MQRARPTSQSDDLRVGPGMRKSMLELREKSLYLRRIQAEPIQAALNPQKARTARTEPAKPKRPVSNIVKEYKETIDKLDQIEAELEEWLGSPIATPPEETPSPQEEIEEVEEMDSLPEDVQEAADSPAPGPTEHYSTDLSLF